MKTDLKQHHFVTGFKPWGSIHCLMLLPVRGTSRIFFNRKLYVVTIFSVFFKLLSVKNKTYLLSPPHRMSVHPLPGPGSLSDIWIPGCCPRIATGPWGTENKLGGSSVSSLPREDMCWALCDGVTGTPVPA